VWARAHLAKATVLALIVLALSTPGRGIRGADGHWRFASLSALAFSEHPAPWVIASWNQHRKSSYLQKDCSWISRLQALGNARAAVNEAIEAIDVEYSPLEIQEWAGDYDLVAIQEADPLFCAALGPDLSRDLIQGSPDRDGRGVRVDSATALLLKQGRGIRAVQSEHAQLTIPMRRGCLATRDHVAVLVERESDGQVAVFCSVHLHPPGQVERAGLEYLDYLLPLRAAIGTAAEVSELGSRFHAPCFLVGDFNVDPEEFKARTQEDPFWSAFDVCIPDGGHTAHVSNPCASGDFAIVAGGVWQGRALGAPDFSGYERYVDRITAAANAQIHGADALQIFKRAVASCQKAASGLHHSGLMTELGGQVQRNEWQPAELMVHKALSTLQGGQRQLNKELRQWRTRRHRKGIMSSDHRPLHFTGCISSIAAEAEGGIS